MIFADLRPYDNIWSEPDSTVAKIVQSTPSLLVLKVSSEISEKQEVIYFFGIWKGKLWEEEAWEDPNDGRHHPARCWVHWRSALKECANFVKNQHIQNCIFFVIYVQTTRSERVHLWNISRILSATISTLPGRRTWRRRGSRGCGTTSRWGASRIRDCNS